MFKVYSWRIAFVADGLTLTSTDTTSQVLTLSYTWIFQRLCIVEIISLCSIKFEAIVESR